MKGHHFYGTSPRRRGGGGVSFDYNEEPVYSDSNHSSTVRGETSSAASSGSALDAKVAGKIQRECRGLVVSLSTGKNLEKSIALGYNNGDGNWELQLSLYQIFHPLLVLCVPPLFSK